MKKLPKIVAKEILATIIKADKINQFIKKCTVAQIELDNKFDDITILLQEVHLTIKPYFIGNKNDLMPLIIAGNTSSSIAGLIEQISANITRVRNASSSISDNLEKFKSIVVSNTDKTPEKIEVEENSFKTWEDGLVAAKQKFNSEEIEIVKEDYKHTEQKVNISKEAIKFLRLLPNSKITSKSYVRLTLPVAAVGSWMHTKFFVSRGLSITNIGGYSIIHDQFILGVNVIALSERNSSLEKRDKETAEEYVINLIKNRKKNYVIVGKGIRYTRKETGFLYFWLIDENDFNQYTQEGEKSFGEEWGLAF